MSARNRGSSRPRYAGLSDIGLVRAGNEDAFVTRPPLFAVADGLGGHQAGEIASSITLETLQDRAPRAADVEALETAVCDANAAVIEGAREGKGRTGMGTTLTAVIVDGLQLAIAHVGDSRAYLMHEGELSRITQDHSMVADMIRQGTLTEEESRYHPNRSVITRALGTDPGVTPDAYSMRASAGDRLLLSTDGLHGQVDDVEIADILSAAETPQDAVDALVEAANSAGGADNVTVVVVDIDGSGAVTPEPETPKPEKQADPGRWRRWLARAGWVLALVAVIAAGWFGLKAYADSKAYLVDENGLVVLYRGIPVTVLGARLYHDREATDVSVEVLAQSQSAVAARLQEPGGIAFESLQAARDALDEYRASQRIPDTTGISPGSTDTTLPVPAAPATP